MRQCVVCGCYDVTGKERRSGYKCGTCVGKSSRPEYRYFSGKLEDYRDLFLETGYGNGQPVKWIDETGAALCGIVNNKKGSLGWWEGCDLIDVLLPITNSDTKKSEVSVPAKDLFPITSANVTFPDERRTGYKVKYEAVSGVLRHSIIIKGVESKSRVVSNITYSSEPPTIYDPDLGITSRAWLPISGLGYLSASAVAWRLSQLAEACGVSHNIPRKGPCG